MDYIAAISAFLEAAQSNNFSRAAERLGIKASTVSRYVKDLEQDLGIALFNRSTRTLHLTEGGETFRLHARRVLEELEQAKAATSALNQRPRGVLKLNLPPAFARVHILPLLGEFTMRYSDIKLELVLEETQGNLIQSGTDLAIRIGLLTDSTLKARKIADERWLLVARADFNTLFEPLPVILPVDGTAAAALHGPDGQETVPRPIAVALRINDLEAQLQAARLGLGAAWLPDWLAAGSIARGELQAWLPGWTLAGEGGPSAVWFVYPPKRIVSSKVRCFIDFVLEKVGRTPYWQRPIS